MGIIDRGDLFKTSNTLPCMLLILHVSSPELSLIHSTLWCLLCALEVSSFKTELSWLPCSLLLSQWRWRQRCQCLSSLLSPCSTPWSSWCCILSTPSLPQGSSSLRAPGTLFPPSGLHISHSAGPWVPPHPLSVSLA